MSAGCAQLFIFSRAARLNLAPAPTLLPATAAAGTTRLAASMDDPEMPELPPSPSRLIGVQRQLSKIKAFKDIAEASVGVCLGRDGRTRCTSGTGHLPMKGIWVRQMLSVAPVLASNLENGMICARLYELACAVAQLLSRCGGDWYNAPNFLFLQVDDALYRRHAQRQTLFVELCECVTAGQRGDQYAVLKAPVITKTLLAGRGARWWTRCSTVRGSAGLSPRTSCATRRVSGAWPRRSGGRVREWCTKLERIVAAHAKKVRPWDRAAIEGRHVLATTGLAFGRPTLQPAWCPTQKGSCRPEGQSR